LLVDETTDLSKQEQMTVCLRYIYNDQLHEDFKVDYLSLQDMTGEGLAAAILTHLRQLQLDLSFMVGQGYQYQP